MLKLTVNSNSFTTFADFSSKTFKNDTYSTLCIGLLNWHRNLKMHLGLQLEAECGVIAEQIVLATIFRAGVPFHQGFLRYFDNAENAFVSAYRKYKEKENFDILIEYLASPRLDGKTLILCDPMLATGASMELSYKALLTKGAPAKLHVASVIASQQAVDYMQSVMPAEAELWVGVIDDRINDHSYIVPGLGDAGDLAYGTKE